MPAPAGAKPARWNQAVSGVASDLGWTQTEADTWLTAVWDQRYTDETSGQIAAHARLRLFLETNRPDDPTLPVALTNWIMN